MACNFCDTAISMEYKRCRHSKSPEQVDDKAQFCDTVISMEYKRCPICAWRRQHIKQDEDATDAPPWACDSACPRILEALHSKPSQTWIDIISTDRLCSPDLPVVRQGVQWVCIPLRCDQNIQESHCQYHYDGLWKDHNQTVIGYHNTRLKSLVNATPSWNGGPIIGCGILKDGRLRYGACTHDGNSGVNVYSDGGLETFDPSTSDEESIWVQLEVRCCNTTSLKGGRAGRFCINGQKGEICYKAAVVALWVPKVQLPAMVFLS